jgi:hypothetical protein
MGAARSLLLLIYVSVGWASPASAQRDAYRGKTINLMLFTIGLRAARRHLTRPPRSSSRLTLALRTSCGLQPALPRSAGLSWRRPAQRLRAS